MPIGRDNLQPGDVVARRYEIAGVLGDGGAGRLYHARGLAGEQLALRLTVASGSTSVQHLKDTVGLHQQLGNSRLGRLRDCGEHAGRVWYAMDYLEGVSLERLVVQSGPVAPAEAVRIVSEAAEGVAAVHRAGFAYQDIKQATIFLVGKNRDVKLTDFGVNAALAHAAGVPVSKLSTPSTFAPGHGDGEPDPRGDLYALGAVLYYAVTGRRVFPAGRQVAQLAANLELPAPPLEDVPKALHRMLKRALAMRVGDRFQTVDEFVSALAKVRAAA